MASLRTYLGAVPPVLARADRPVVDPYLSGWRRVLAVVAADATNLLRVNADARFRRLVPAVVDPPAPVTGTLNRLVFQCP